MKPLMQTVNEIPATISNNLIGAAIGGLILFKAANINGITTKWKVVGISVAGIIVGASIQRAISARNSLPTAEIINKK